MRHDRSGLMWTQRGVGLKYVSHVTGRGREVGGTGPATVAAGRVARHQVVQGVGAGVLVLVGEPAVGPLRRPEVSVGVGREVLKVATVGRLHAPPHGVLGLAQGLLKLGGRGGRLVPGTRRNENGMGYGNGKWKMKMKMKNEK